MSEEKEMTGGSVQGTILGPLLFILYIASIGQDVDTSQGQIPVLKFIEKLEDTIVKLKYVDDMTLIESFKLSEHVVNVPPPVFPGVCNYRERTGHKLCTDQLKMSSELDKLVKFTNLNLMKLNQQKTIVSIFNKSRTFDCPPILELNGSVLKYEENFKLLGVNFNTQLDFSTHVTIITKKALKKLWMIKRLIKNHVPKNIAVLMYTCHVRSILEYAAPVFHHFLKQSDTKMLEMVQESFLKVIFGYNKSYSDLCNEAGLDMLSERRTALCLKFLRKEVKK